MQIEYVARDFHLSDTVRDLGTDKLHKLEKFLQEPISAHVVLEVQKHHHRADVHITHRHGSLQATDTSEDMRDSLHHVVDKLEKQARRSAKKHQINRRRSGRIESDPEYWSLDVVESRSVGSGDEPRVVRSNRLHVKPMTIEEAALQLEESDSEFLVFREADEATVSVLYRRRDGNYGLISPEV